MERTCEWLRKCRKDGFQSALADTKEIADEAETDPVFNEVTVMKRKRPFAYEGLHEPVQPAEANFHVNVSMLSWAKLYHPWNPVFNS